MLAVPGDGGHTPSMSQPAPRPALRSRAVTGRRLPFQRRLLLIALGGGLPAVAVTLFVLARLDWPASVRIFVALLVLGCWAGGAIALQRATVEPLRALANLLESLAAGDFSVRGRHPRRGDALGDVVIEANRLGATLRGQRFAALEATALLDKVVAELEVAVLAFDGDDRVRLANPAAGALLRCRPEALLGRVAVELGLQPLLQGPPRSNEVHEFPAAGGRWQVLRSTFREGGQPFRLLVVTDLSAALREEERRAWRRLIRVIWHELNNSLAPIKSVIETARDALATGPLEADERHDLAHALALMASRADGLRRFLSRYSELARLPEPRPVTCDVKALLEHVAAVLPPDRVHAESEPGLMVRADPDQLEQALINLLRNAVEATPPEGPAVLLSARAEGGQVVFEVLDGGSGVANPENLFVPFFSTKKGGSGIGLLLARQVAEGHGGSISLQNRGDGAGCRARLVIPA
jgi:two-component system, NtrC family, nitrogen regulation sensor histidine kinase NtrY